MTSEFCELRDHARQSWLGRGEALKPRASSRSGEPRLAPCCAAEGILSGRRLEFRGRPVAIARADRPVRDLVTDVGDRQYVAGLEPPRGGSLPVDPDSVGAAQVAHPDLAFDFGQAAVPPRHPRRDEPRVAVPMPADNDHPAIHDDVGSSG